VQIEVKFLSEYRILVRQADRNYLRLWDGEYQRGDLDPSLTGWTYEQLRELGEGVHEIVPKLPGR
jgi:hypothetical protein